MFTVLLNAACFLLVQTGAAPAAMPAAANPTPSAATSVEVQSVWDFVLKGGPMMIPIGLCSLIALTVFVERLVSLRRGRVIPAAFVSGVRERLNGGDDPTKALDYCNENGAPLANIFAAGIRKLGQGQAVMEKHVQDAGEREVLKLRKYLRLLSVIAAIAPLLGLLGTIFGMIDAFQTVAVSAEAMGKTELLAKGIYQAMITTAAGLLVAIPVLVGYHWISGRIDLLVAEMDQVTVDFLDELTAAQRTSDSTDTRENGDAPQRLSFGPSAAMAT